MIVLLPIYLTLFSVLWLLDHVDRLVTAPIRQWVGVALPGIGLVTVLLLVLLVGWLTTHLVGQQMITMGERVMQRIPVVKGLYRAVKQMTEAVFSPREQPFTRVVLVEYPRRGIFSVGFVAGEMAGTDLLRVWIPPGPSPTAGPIVLVPSAQAVELPMAVEDGFKLIVSAGAFTPRDADVKAMAAAAAELTRRSGA